jgi:hypothetical protein
MSTLDPTVPRTNSAEPLMRSSILFHTLILIACFAPLPGFASDQIIETVEKSPQVGEKVRALLTIGTSASNPDMVLGNKQALIAAEIRKLLKSAGIQVFAIGLKPGEPDASKVIAEGVAKFDVSHTLSLAIPSGTVLVKRATGESVAAKAYEVKTQLKNAKTGEVVWAHTAQVDAGLLLGASNSDVAQTIVARMRSDGLL